LVTSTHKGANLSIGFPSRTSNVMHGKWVFAGRVPLRYTLGRGAVTDWQQLLLRDVIGQGSDPEEVRRSLG
jgi:hypothetical protein